MYKKILFFIVVLVVILGCNRPESHKSYDIVRDNLELDLRRLDTVPGCSWVETDVRLYDSMVVNIFTIDPDGTVVLGRHIEGIGWYEVIYDTLRCPSKDMMWLIDSTIPDLEYYRGDPGCVVSLREGVWGPYEGFLDLDVLFKEYGYGRFY